MTISKLEYEQMTARVEGICGDLKSGRYKMLADKPALENDLHQQIIAECKRFGFYYVHSRTDKRTTNAIGTPDFVLALPDGVVWWIEVKIKGNKPTREQMAVGVMLKKLGQNYALVYSIDEFYHAICDKACEKRDAEFFRDNQL
jgi:hypothetical protein